MLNNADRILKLDIPALDDPMLAIELTGEDHLSQPFNFKSLLWDGNNSLAFRRIL